MARRHGGNGTHTTEKAVTPDQINGVYEALGGLFILLNCRKTWQAKKVAGVSLVTIVFFSSWEFWNLYYYPALDQWWSFWGGAVIAAANLLWIWLVVHYSWGWKTVPKRLKMWARYLTHRNGPLRGWLHPSEPTVPKPLWF
jgi:hypothetical protein